MRAPPIIVLAVVATVLPAPPAMAECRVSFPGAVACFDPEAAAQAFKIVGRDARVLDRDYVRAVLERANCVSFRNVADAGRPIRLAARARVPSLEGWTEVQFLAVDSARVGGSAVWIASAWVEGDCAPMPHSGQ